MNLDDYKEIHESQKFNSKVNFFAEDEESFTQNSNKKIIKNDKIIDNEESDNFCASINKFNNEISEYKNIKVINKEQNIKQNSKRNLMNNKNTLNENITKSINPLNEINEDNSIISDLTKFRQFALNEINQSK